jgi:hypothetical protein
MLANRFNTYFFLFIIGLLSLGAAPAMAQSHLQLPVDFMIENGNFQQTVVTVKKDGATIFTVPGKTYLKIRLEFNNDYVLSFSKPGYITKMIAVNTAVPPERMAQSFEPYKIGVKLFRQYDGVNIVVFNQPVARIHFNPSIDDFDYDVDYTKSILSILKQTEEELMVKAAEERSVNSGSMVVQRQESISDDQHTSTSSGQMTEQRIKPSSPSLPQKQLSIGDPPITKDPVLSNPNPDIDPKPAPALIPGEDPGNKPVRAAEEDHVTPGVRSANEEKIEGGNASGSSDPRNTSDNIAESERNNVSRISSLGDDLLEGGKATGDIEHPGEKSISKDIYTSRRFVLEEPNRTITTIKISKGVSIAEYRKVDYKWGGVFYFQDGTYAISRNIFHWATGEY